MKLTKGYRFEEAVPIDSLEPNPLNVNQGDVGAITQSIEAHGFFGVVVAQESGRIIAGEHRWRAAVEQGAESIPVVFVDVDDESALKMLLADNQASRLSHNDEAALAELLQSFDSLDGTLFDGDDLDQLLEDLGKHEVKFAGDKDEVPEPPKTAVTKPGDVWLLGDHRLACGDCTDSTVVEKALDGTRPGAIYADPPYGMNLQTDYTLIGHGHSTRKHQPVIGDDVPFDASGIIAAFDDVDEQFWWGADYYRDTIPSGGAWVVWDKRGNDAGMRLDDLFGAHFELCWSRALHKREIARILWALTHGQERPGEDAARGLHPTQKPVDLACWFFDRWVPKGAVVLDPFAGSGTTLIAAEATGRICAAIEISPGYCDVICKRFQTLTGVLPVLEASGQSHDFV